MAQAVALLGPVDGVETIENPSPEQLKAILERRRKKKSGKG